MEKTAIGIGLLSLLFLLGACSGGKTDARVEHLQKEYAALTAYHTGAEVTVPRGEELLRYTLDVTAQDGKSNIRVIKPDYLTGIEAHLEGEELSLSYDAVVLDAASTCESISGVNCVARTVNAVAHGFAESYAPDGDGLYVRFRMQSGGEDLYYNVRFDKDGKLLSCEIESEETVVIYLGFDAWEHRLPDGA